MQNLRDGCMRTLLRSIWSIDGTLDSANAYSYWTSIKLNERRYPLSFVFGITRKRDSLILPFV